MMRSTRTQDSLDLLGAFPFYGAVNPTRRRFRLLMYGASQSLSSSQSSSVLDVHCKKSCRQRFCWCLPAQQSLSTVWGPHCLDAIGGPRGQLGILMMLGALTDGSVLFSIPVGLYCEWINSIRLTSNFERRLFVRSSLLILLDSSTSIAPDD